MAKGMYIGVSSKARKVKKMYIGVESEKRTLPTGYTQVQYLESTGTQYIDTGFNPSDNSRVLIMVSDVSKASYLFGARDPYTDAIKQGFGAYAKSATTIRSDYFTGTVTETVDSMIGKETIDKNGNVLKAYGKTITNTAVSSRTVPCPLYLMALNNNGTAAVFSSIKVYSCQIYDNGVLVRDFVPCKNASGTGGMYDLVNSKFYTNAGTGTFTVGSTTLSVARRIKKAYIGIGGVARPCFTGGELARWGIVSSYLNWKREDLAATSVGDYAVFGGGERYDTGKATGAVDAYSSSLTKKSTSSLGTNRKTPAATTVGNWAIFGGGYNDDEGFVSSTDGYNQSLSKSWTIERLSVARGNLAATTVGGYALFGGGYGNSQAQSTVDVYDESLTQTTPTKLSAARYGLAATTVGGYALFGGGLSGDYPNQKEYTTVDAYDESLTRTTLDGLSSAQCQGTATYVGDYAIFGGGHTYNRIDVYDKFLTHTNVSFRVSHIYPAATSLGDYALFGGGFSSGVLTKVVEAFDTSLTLTLPAGLYEAKSYFAATSVGDYALFGGGYLGSNNYSDTVDAYTVQ